MAFDQELAARVRDLLAGKRAVEEKKMMGGLTFMVNGKMCVGVLKDDLMVRLDPETYQEALLREGAREMDIMKRPTPGFVFVSREGTASKTDLSRWIDLALEFNKKAKASKKRR